MFIRQNTIGGGTNREWILVSHIASMSSDIKEAIGGNVDNFFEDPKVGAIKQLLIRFGLIKSDTLKMKERGYFFFYERLPQHASLGVPLCKVHSPTKQKGKDTVECVIYDKRVRDPVLRGMRDLQMRDRELSFSIHEEDRSAPKLIRI